MIGGTVQVFIITREVKGVRLFCLKHYLRCPGKKKSFLRKQMPLHTYTHITHQQLNFYGIFFSGEAILVTKINMTYRILIFIG